MKNLSILGHADASDRGNGYLVYGEASVAAVLAAGGDRPNTIGFEAAYIPAERLEAVRAKLALAGHVLATTYRDA